MRRSATAAFLAAVLAGCAASATDGADDPLAESASFSPSAKADGTQPLVYSSATTVSALAYDRGTPRSATEVEAILAERVAPSVARGDETLPPGTYLRRMSALGYYGPLGPYGPLGVLGPLGGNPWNPDLYVSGSFAWADWSEMLTDEDGPLSAHGPLGSTGPLAREYWGEGAGFTTHLQPGGLFAPLGPVGPTGALGPLGPLGPVGAHGYLRRDGGDYWPAAEDACHHAPAGDVEPPCRTIEVEWTPGGELRTYELFERYDEDHARTLPDNDTSFMVEGLIPSAGAEQDEYLFHSREDQWVTVVVVPEHAKYPYAQAMSLLGAAASNGYETPEGAWIPHLLTGVPVYASYYHQPSFDDFDLALRVRHDGRRAEVRSESGDAVDWIQVFVPAGTTLEARVSLYAAWQVASRDAWWGLAVRPSSPRYRLYVVGSTSHGLARADLSGPYLRELPLE